MMVVGAAAGGRAKEFLEARAMHGLWMRMAAMASTLGLVVPTGCGRGPSRIHPPTINATVAGQAAMKEYDRNGDGAVAGDELDKAPSLKAALTILDADSDGRVTAEEVTARIEAWQASKIGMMSQRCEVLLDGSPLPGALVVYEPEAFLGPNVKPASGVTDDLGVAFLTIAESERPNPSFFGIHCGLYLVRITKGDRGQQVLPAGYNIVTTLGAEVAPDARDAETGSVFRLNMGVSPAQ